VKTFSEPKVPAMVKVTDNEAPAQNGEPEIELVEILMMEEGTTSPVLSIVAV
jgi:hypothetical protein